MYTIIDVYLVLTRRHAHRRRHAGRALRKHNEKQMFFSKVRIRSFGSSPNLGSNPKPMYTIIDLYLVLIRRHARRRRHAGRAL